MPSMLKKTLYLLSVAVVLLPGTSALSQAPTDVVIEHNVAMKTRDGVTLYADVYRPAGDDSFPVLLVRTPYDKTGDAGFGRMAALRGFMVVAQDVRGRYTSEGEWYTFKHEIEDGYDTVEWAAALPHSNGRVGMFSGSYVGATQMLATIGHPPHLAGICPVVTASNYHENWTYQGGAFEQWFNQSWTAGLAQDTANREIKRATNALVADNVLPLNRFPVFNLQSADGENLTHELAPYYLDWLAHPNYDSYWKQWSIEENFGSIQVPALVIAAWYDIFQGGSLRNYLGIRAHGGTEATRNQTQLVVAIEQEGRRSRFRARCAFRRERNYAGLVRLPFQRQAESVCQRQACKDFRNGREQVARRGELAAGASTRDALLPAFRRQGEQRKR